MVGLPVGGIVVGRGVIVGPAVGDKVVGLGEIVGDRVVVVGLLVCTMVGIDDGKLLGARVGLPGSGSGLNVGLPVGDRVSVVGPGD